MKSTNTDQMKSIFPYIFGTIVFVVAIILTDAKYWGDTFDYVDSVVAFEQGKNRFFWEFGHLFWRPLGWFVWNRLFPLSENNYWRGEATLTFQWFSLIAGLCSTLILIGILKRFKTSLRVIAFTTVSFVFSCAFLNYTQTGNSYVSALMFSLLGLLFGLRETNGKNVFNPILSGICLAITLCFWMPFLWTIPALICAPLVLFGFNRQKLVETAFKIASFSFVLAVFFGSALIILQIDNFSDLKAWITAAAHGDETRGVMRTIFGLARSFVDMGSDGILFKRFILNDSLNPVSFWRLVNESLWKLTAFYGMAAGVLFLMWQNAWGKKIFLWLFIALVPVIGFACVSAGGEIEWYLPLFPFAFIGLANALQTEEWKFIRYAVVTIVLVFALVNANAFSVWKIAQQQEKPISRLNSLESKAAPEDTIFLVNWLDDLINFNRSSPFNPLNRDGNLRINVIVTPGTAQTRQWREEFAVRCLSAWDKKNNAWLSTRAFSQEPNPDWNWVEGDDKNVNWHEFPEFFNKLETGETTGDQNGFTLILPSDKNKTFLQEYKDKFAGQIWFPDGK